MEERKRTGCRKGKFLFPGEKRRLPGRWIMMLILLAWDGLLLYMIVECLIEPVYGAAFAAAVSFYLGYQI